MHGNSEKLQSRHAVSEPGPELGSSQLQIYAATLTRCSMLTQKELLSEHTTDFPKLNTTIPYPSALLDMGRKFVSSIHGCQL
jgi:hypothetical protein